MTKKEYTVDFKEQLVKECQEVQNGEIVGNIVYTKAKILGDDGISREVLSFGPVSVLPTFWAKGIGSALIEYTIARAKESGYRAILIYGDPEYYKRFGFIPAETFGIGTADNMYAELLQATDQINGNSKLELQ